MPHSGVYEADDDDDLLYTKLLIYPVLGFLQAGINVAII